MLAFAFLFCLSCDKQKEKTLVDEKNLTACAENATCQYSFTEQADLATMPLMLRPGAYRVFWASTKQGPITATLWMKAPMSGNQFTLNDQDILAGKVIFNQDCISCNMVYYKAVGGEVKGTNTTPDRRADQARWLLEAKIFLQAVDDPTVKNSINIKQYYGANFVYN